MIPATLEHDILETLRERDLEVIDLRAQLRRRGQAASRETVYETLARLEASELVRVDAAQSRGGKARRALWGAR